MSLARFVIDDREPPGPQRRGEPRALFSGGGAHRELVDPELGRRGRMFRGPRRPVATGPASEHQGGEQQAPHRACFCACSAAPSIPLPQPLRPARGWLAREGRGGAHLQPRAASLRRRSRWLLSPPMPRHPPLRAAPGRLVRASFRRGRNIVKRVLMTLSCIIVVACGGSEIDRSVLDLKSAEATAHSQPSARSALFAADASHSAQIERLGPVEGVVRAMRGNALYLAAGIDIVQGKQDIRATLSAAEPNPSQTTLRRTLAGGDVSADGRFGFTFGWIERTAVSGGSSLTTYGTYVSTWEREDDDPFRVTVYYTRVSLTPHIPTRDGFPLLLGGTGALGYPAGKAVASIPNPDGSVDRFYSKYLTLWARQADGAWRFVADGGASSPSPG